MPTHEQAERNRRLHDLYLKANSFLDRVEDRLTREDVATLRRFGFVGELGLMIDSLVADLIRVQVPLSPAEYTSIAEILSRFDKPPYDHFPHLSDSEGTLRSLHLAPPVASTQSDSGDE